jgi:hypothetical protein
VLDAEQLASAWRSDSGRLVTTTTKPIARGRRVTVAVSGPGSVMAPLTGVAASIRSEGSASTIEIDLDGDQRGAVGRLLGFLRTGKDAPRARAPRYPLALPVFVTSGAGSTYMNTFSVSRGGCGLAWNGAPPRVGSMLDLRLGSGAGSAAFRAMVCWVREQNHGRRVGIRFVAGQDAALVALLKAALAAANGPRSSPAT